MNQERLLTVLRAPHISEKASMQAGDYMQYIFKVAVDAAKPEIKAAVEKMFNVAVRNVTVVNMKGKKTRFGRTEGRRKGWKKAYIVLEKGHEIEATS